MNYIYNRYWNVSFTSKTEINNRNTFYFYFCSKKKNVFQVIVYSKKPLTGLSTKWESFFPKKKPRQYST